MTHSFFTIRTLVSTALDRSGLAFAPKIALMPALAQAAATVTRSDADVTLVTRRSWLIYGRVRWSTGRVIIEWQTRQTKTTDNFAIYRSQKLNGRDATPVDLPIYVTHDSRSHITSYRAVDATAVPPGPYYYWIVNLRAKHGENRFGPYIAQIDGPIEIG